jgi:hypothetical protein
MLPESRHAKVCPAFLSFRMMMMMMMMMMTALQANALRSEDYINEGHPCNDGNKCTINGVRTHGVCQGVPKACTSSTCVDQLATLTQVKVTPPYLCCLFMPILREPGAALSLMLKLRTVNTVISSNSAQSDSCTV